MKKGFTLIELLVALTLMIILLSIVTDNLKQFLFSRTRAAEILEFSATLSTARSKAISGEGDKSYKIVIGPSSYTLQSEDNQVLSTHTVSQFVNIIYSESEIEFEQVSGESPGCDPDCTVEFRLTGSGGGQADFTVSARGIIYENE